jgi:hypothetical protein
MIAKDSSTKKNQQKHHQSLDEKRISLDLKNKKAINHAKRLI